MGAVKMKLNSQGMQILMGELRQNEIWAIYLMGLGKEMTDIVTKLDLTRIIIILCKKLNWIEVDEDSLDNSFNREEDIRSLKNTRTLERSLKNETPDTSSDLESINTHNSQREVEIMDICTESENESGKNNFSVQFTGQKQISERPSKEQDMGERILKEEHPGTSAISRYPSQMTESESINTNSQTEVKIIDISTESENESGANNFQVQSTSLKQTSERHSKEQDLGEQILNEENPGTLVKLTYSDSINTNLQEEVESNLNYCTEISYHHSSMESENESGKNDLSVQSTGPKQILKKPSEEQSMRERTSIEEFPDASRVISDSESINTNLQEEAMEILARNDDKQLSFSKCDKIFVNISALARHKKKTKSDKKFSCSWCDYKSSCKRNLKVHERTHTGDKPFSCSQCNYRGLTSSHLKQHELTHTGAKPYSCSFCDYKSTQKSNLKKHEGRIHTGDQPFCCSWCGKKFSQRVHLRVHERSHIVVKM